jgi:hypothetical protein
MGVIIFFAPDIFCQHGAIDKATNNKHYTHTPSAGSSFRRQQQFHSNSELKEEKKQQQKYHCDAKVSTK